MGTIAAQPAFLEIYSHHAGFPGSVFVGGHLEGFMAASFLGPALTTGLRYIAFFPVDPWHFRSHSSPPHLSPY
jgi:hypothetical protein